MWIRKRTTFVLVNSCQRKHELNIVWWCLLVRWTLREIGLYTFNIIICHKIDVIKPCVTTVFYCSRYILNQSKTWLKLRKAKCLFMGMEWWNYILHFGNSEFCCIRLNEVHFLISQITKVRAEGNNWNTSGVCELILSSYSVQM